MLEQWIITAVNELGFPLIVGIVALIIVLRLTNAYFNREGSSLKMVESSHQELITLRASEARIIQERHELEKKYTACREEVIELRNQLIFEQSKREDAVEGFLDDTQNFDKELGRLEKQVLKLTGELTEKDAIIAERDATIKKLIDEKYS